MLTFRFSGADGRMVTAETLTSGMVGKEIKLEFTADWDGLTKTAVFTAGGVTRDVVGVSDSAVIPAEVLARPLQQLQVGIYGVAPDGRVTPTVRAEGPRILPGANPSGDTGAAPDLPVWAQLQQRMKALEEKLSEEGQIMGLNAARISALQGMFRACVFSGDQDADSAVSAFETAFGLSDPGGDVGGEDNGGTDAGGGNAPIYTVTNNLINVVNSNTATTASGFYSAALSWASGYAMNSIIITMGGVDVTDQVYGDGSILITEVTGDIVITAEAGIPVLYQLANTPVTCNADLYEDTGLTIGASDAELYAKNWTLCAAFTRTANCDWLAGIPGASTPNDTFGIRGHLSDGGRFPQFMWCKNAAADFVDNGIKCKMIVTHEANANNVNVYSENAGGFISTVSSAYGRPADAFYAGTLYVGGNTAADFMGTIEDFTVYGSVLSEADINAYLGVA